MSGQSIKKIVGTAVYIAGNDIDTDRIIPARYLKCVTFDELGPALFYDERFDEKGVSKNHVLDARQHQGAGILISDENFGCGSSREHAPQAIKKSGFSAIIAGSFAEIFHGNSTTLGIPCVVMSKDDRESLVKLINEDPQHEILIDIEAGTVSCANQIYRITIKESTREAFLSAKYDPLDVLLANKDKIKTVADKLGYI